MDISISIFSNAQCLVSCDQNLDFMSTLRDIRERQIFEH